jgi:hypothetical protein
MTSWMSEGVMEGVLRERISMLGGAVGPPEFETKRTRTRRVEMTVRPMVTMRPARSEPKRP